MTHVGRELPKAPVFDARRLRKIGVSAGWSVAAVLLGLVVWQLVSMQTQESVLPSPAATWSAAKDLWADGTLLSASLASVGRILLGWALGLLVGAPLGLLIGEVRIVRKLIDPFMQFFRFVPPISLVTLAIIWFGIGEASKVFLIFYTTIFIVVLATAAGRAQVSNERVLAARTLGASRLQVISTVVLPSTVPSLVTGARLAMGNSFLTIVSAEIVAAETGLGALIWQARNFGQTEWVFVGIFVLGLLGLLFDICLQWLGGSVLKRYTAG